MAVAQRYHIMSALGAFSIGATLSLFLLSSSIFNSAYGQNNSAQSLNADNLASNNISYSYNINRNASNTSSNATVESDVLQNQSVSYYNNTSGYLVYPKSQNATQKQLPAVIMIHEWWGLNKNIKNQADMLAKEGYVVFAVDLFQGQVATDSNSASQLTSQVRKNPGSAISNLKAAIAYVKSLDLVDDNKIASLGWCFGGDWSLQLAINSKDTPLAATVLYYGRPVTDPASLASIKWPVLGIFGDQDQSISVQSVKQFAASLNASGIVNEIYLYKGVGHAFANPSGDNYAPTQTVDTWQKTLAFLREHLGSHYPSTFGPLC